VIATLRLLGEQRLQHRRRQLAAAAAAVCQLGQPDRRLDADLAFHASVVPLRPEAVNDAPVLPAMQPHVR
jgi:hypothetical protein